MTSNQFYSIKISSILIHEYICFFGKNLKYMKNFLKNLFLYKETESPYPFIIPELPNENNKAQMQEPDNLLPNKSVSNNLKENIDYLTVQYNALINSDIIFRKFVISFCGKNYDAFFLGIDGMIDSTLVNNFLLRPLMESPRNKSSKKVSLSNNLKMQKSFKFSLEDYLFNKLIPQSDISKEKDFSNIISAVNGGDCALFVDTLNTVFVIDVKGYKSRSISVPNNEIVVRGSQEAFVEKLRSNTSLLRRLINNENLIIENTTVGKISKTQIAICYMKNITNDNLVNEVKYRINNLNVDFIISSGQLEQLIQDNSRIAFPQLIATERPDKAANHLLEGRVVVLVNGSPYSLIMPGVLIDFLSSPEDINLKHQYSNLLKFIRIVAAFFTLLLPGLYVAITTYHVELIPTELLFTMASARNSVPFPVIVEILVMEICFELIREAGLRIPTPIGPTIGIIRGPNFR